MFTHHASDRVNSSALSSWTVMYEAQDHQCLPIPGVSRGVDQEGFLLHGKEGERSRVVVSLIKNTD